MKKWLSLFAGILLMIEVAACLEATYAIYWGDTLAGTYGNGLIAFFVGWFPGLVGLLIGLVLILFSIYLVIWAVREFRKK